MLLINSWYWILVTSVLDIWKGPIILKGLDESFSDEDFQNDWNYLENRIKAQIANAIWGKMLPAIASVRAVITSSFVLAIIFKIITDTL